MKLLPQAEIKSVKRQASNSAQALRDQLTKELHEKTAQLNSLKMELNEFGNRLKEEKIEIQRAHDLVKTQLVNEIASLEAQKRDMFVPVKAKEAHLIQREIQVAKHEREQQKEWTALFQKQSQLSIIEQELRSAEKQYFKKTDELKAWEVELKNRDEALKEQEQKFNARLREANADYEARFATVNEAIVITKTKQVEYETLKAEVDKERIQVNEERKHVESQRHSLARAYEAGKKKHIF